MVHRPADARLLANLLSQEKEYSKSLASLLDTSQVSLASFAAYASATPPPTSQHIVAVADSLAIADDALRKYMTSVDAWREGLQMLKDMEEEVGNVMRDREILVTRLIKVSKQKSSRDSNNPTPSPSSSHFSASSSSLRLASPKSKLTHAQTELQACEAHLAAKEAELQQLRMVVVTGRLRDRCRMLVECGMIWGEVGKAAISALEGSGSVQMLNGTAHPYGYNLQYKPLPHPDHDLPDRPSSDISSSLAPSQSASQVAPTPPRSSSSADSHDNTKPYRLSIPPAHSVGDHLFPPSVPGARRVSTVNEEDENIAAFRNGTDTAYADDTAGGGSSDDESQVDERQIEVHDNAPFGLSNPHAKSRGKLKISSPFHSLHHGSTSTSAGGISTSISAPNRLDSQHTLRLSSHQQQDSDSSPSRKRTKSNVLGLRTIAGLFRKSSSTSDVASGSGSPTKSRGSGWMTRTDKHLRDVARGKDDSDDEDTVNAYGRGGGETSIDYAALRKKSAVESKGLPSNPPMDSDSSPSPGKRKLRKGTIRGSSAPPESPTSSPRSNTKKKQESSPLKTSAGPSSGLSRNGTIQSIKSSSGDTSASRITRQRSKSLHIEPSTISTLSTSNGNSTLSRSTSIKSNSTAKGKAKNGEEETDGSPNVRRRPSAKKRPESWSHLGPGTSSVLRTSSTSGSGTHTHTHRSQSLSLSVPSSRSHTPAQSLMSIVEGVTAQNRAAWGQVDPNKGLVDIKAPKSLSLSLSGADLDLRTPYGPGGVVVGSRKEKKGSGSSSPRSSRPNSFAASAPSLVTVPTTTATTTSSTSSNVVASPATSSSTLRAPSPVHAVGHGGSVNRGQSMPLKSALRNRTPSPNPAAMNSTAITGGGSSPVNSAVSSGSGSGSGSGDSIKLTLSTSNLKPPGSNTLNGRGNGDDDTVSINSSINDVFEDANEEIPPTPPPHDIIDPLATPTLNANNGNISSINHNSSGVSKSQHDSAHDNETDISFSSTSTTIPGSGLQGQGQAPVRRKSVRMSSQLMFSSTPPAIEYYEDTPWSREDEVERKRRSIPNGDATATASSGWKSRLDERTSAAASADGVNHWEDSGSEDEDYSRAKQLFSKASRGLDKITGKGR